MFGSKSIPKELKGPSGMETVIGADTVIQGTVSSKGSVRVDGKLEGGVTNAASVVVGQAGEIHGDVTSGAIIIGGKVIGNIAASSSIEILPNSEIHGDIKTAALSIAEGATFEGNCTMTKEKQVIEMEVGKRGRS